MSETPQTTPETTSAFELSRIYGQGWNAAKKLLASQKGNLAAPFAAANNPYRAPEERQRWMKGFTEALESRAGSFTTSGGSAWRPAVAKRNPAGK